MKQRGRSSADLLRFPQVEARSQPVPPTSLTKRERDLFAELAASVTHLTATDAPMLASYVQTILLARQLGRDAARIAEFEKLVRAQTLLARALRLTAKARINPISVGRRLQGSPPSYYDRINDAET